MYIYNPFMMILAACGSPLFGVFLAAGVPLIIWIN
jgi:hypothetical protein